MANLNLPTLADRQDNKVPSINEALDKIDSVITEELVVSVDSSNAGAVTAEELQEARAISVIADSPAPTAGITLTLEAFQRGDFVVLNKTTQVVTVTITGQSSTAPTVAIGQAANLYMDGVNVSAVASGSGSGGGGTVNLQNASESARGIVELSDERESNDLADTTRAISPGRIPIASESQQGLAEIATQNETQTGADDSRYVTPLKLSVEMTRRLAGFTPSMGDIGADVESDSLRSTVISVGNTQINRWLRTGWNIPDTGDVDYRIQISANLSASSLLNYDETIIQPVFSANHLRSQPVRTINSFSDSTRIRLFLLPLTQASGAPRYADVRIARSSSNELLMAFTHGGTYELDIFKQEAIATGGGGGGSGDDAFDWATVGNTDTIPDNKIPSGITRDTELNARIDNTDLPDTGGSTTNAPSVASVVKKIAAIPSGGGSGDDAFDWATVGNTDEIPVAKIPTITAGKIEISQRLPTATDGQIPEYDTDTGTWLAVDKPTGGGGGGTPDASDGYVEWQEVHRQAITQESYSGYQTSTYVIPDDGNHEFRIEMGINYNANQSQTLETTAAKLRALPAATAGSIPNLSNSEIVFNIVKSNFNFSRGG